MTLNERDVGTVVECDVRRLRFDDYKRKANRYRQAGTVCGLTFEIEEVTQVSTIRASIE